jgi:hypothetical protein
MKQILLTILLACTFWNLKAQSYKQQRTGRVYGKIIDNKTRKGLEAVSVQIKKQVNDSISLQKDSIIAGMFTRANGEFSFEDIPFNNTVML